MWDKKVAGKIVGWGVGLFLLACLLVSYLATSLNYISEAVAIKMYLALAGIMALITLQYLLATDKKERKEILIGLALATAFFLVRRWTR